MFRHSVHRHLQSKRLHLTHLRYGIEVIFCLVDRRVQLGAGRLARCLLIVCPLHLGAGDQLAGLCNLALWFGLHVLFATVGEARLGLFALPLPDLASFDPWAALIAVAAGVALLRYHVNMIAVLAAAAAAGMALRLTVG